MDNLRAILWISIPDAAEHHRPEAVRTDPYSSSAKIAVVHGIPFRKQNASAVVIAADAALKCKRNHVPDLNGTLFRLQLSIDCEGSVTEYKDAEEELHPRVVRADAKRNLDSLLQAAASVFASSGVDAPIREIATQAGVGVGTLYRHFPKRSDMIVAIMRREMEACADAAITLSAEHPPVEALGRWMQRYVDLVSAKRGLAAALHSGDPAYEPLAAYFDQRLRPALQKLLDDAVSESQIREGVSADDLLVSVSSLCMSAQGSDGIARARRVVSLLTDGLRFRKDDQT